MKTLTLSLAALSLLAAPAYAQTRPTVAKKSGPAAAAAQTKVTTVKSKRKVARTTRSAPLAPVTTPATSKPRR